jgi:ribokinase
MSILSFGSINLDLVARVPRLPIAGETLTGSTFLTTPGGKGANQAVAAARLGVPTKMLGRVGADEFGRSLLADLQTAGVDTQAVLVDETTHSGVALITVSATGENQIVVIPGANGQVDGTDVERLHPLLAQTQVLLLQLEIPLPIVKLAAQAAHAAGVIVMLDPAPVPAENLPEIYPWVNILTPNQVEAAQLVGFAVDDRAAAERAAIALHQAGAATVIVKLGAQGMVCATADQIWHVPAFPVDVVDTVAAGDAFAGGLAAALATGQALESAVIWASAAGALAVTQSGAQTAMPDRAALEAFLQQHGELP